MGRLLRLMDKLRLELDDGESADLPLLGEISDYLLGFPDACHHPKEDLIYNRLGELQSGLKELGSDLEYEHERLHRLVDGFVERVKSIKSDDSKSMAELSASMQKLVKTYKRHMEMEEKHLFPMAVEKLSADDWSAINSTLFETTDPLRNDAESRFANIRAEIAKLAEHHDERNRLLTGIDADLQDLQSIDQVNDLFASNNTGFRMEKAAQGGFLLTEQGDVLLELPPCSEERAAWCAWSFVKACT